MEDALTHWNHTFTLHSLDRLALAFAHTSCFSANQTGTSAAG